MQLQVEKIHVRYIPKRYTRLARKDVEFDRCDLRQIGEDGNTKSYRTTLLITKAMSARACERGLELLDTACKELQQIPPDIGPSATKRGKSPASVEEDANLGSWSWQVKSNCGKTFDVEGMTSNLVANLTRNYDYRQVVL
jgi:hypothetical protein